MSHCRSRRIFKAKKHQNLIKILAYLYFILNLLHSSSANEYKGTILNLNSFIDNKFEICGDKYMARTETGEVYVSTDLGANWIKIKSLAKIKKIKIFENQEIIQRRDVYNNKSENNLDFIRKYFYKKSKNEEFDIQPSNSNSGNVVFITNQGKIIFSKKCGLDLFDKDFIYANDIIKSNLRVQDYYFHPIQKDKGVIIANDSHQSIIYGSSNLDSGEKNNLDIKEIYLTKNFGQSFKRLEYTNDQEQLNVFDFKWYQSFL